VGARRYRPHFDLWTIWGAFSPVPYRAGQVSLAVTPIDRLRVRVHGERYEYDNTETATPLVSFETSGWRFSWGATYTPSAAWTLDGGYQSEFGNGASSRGFEGSVSYAVAERLSLVLNAATLDRPLEFRYDDASLKQYGVQAVYRASPRALLQLDASRYLEDRRRPDAAAFDWDQLRCSARVVLLFGRGADFANLPPAVRRMPGGRATQ
jgi:hypothetical protein